jgi:hypothetical protein
VEESLATAEAAGYRIDALHGPAAVPGEAREETLASEDESGAIEQGTQQAKEPDSTAGPVES